jgi:hypothetical protein
MISRSSAQALYSRQALTYYLLCLPALVSEVLFSLAIASNSQLVPQIASFGSEISLAVQILPWVVTLLSIYALISFRPSILIILLTVSFFAAASVTTNMTFFGYPFSLDAAVALVVVSTFTTLVGFNFSRGAKLLGGRKLVTKSSGPLGYQVLSLGIELVLPLLAALGLVLFVSAFFGAMKAQALLLPQPLSTLTSLYLGTIWGFALTTILVAGVTIWVLKQVVEPIVLYYSITSQDAKRLALEDIKDIKSKLNKETRNSPSGLRWILPAALVSLFALVYLERSLGFGNLSSVLWQVVTLQKTTAASSVEAAFQNSANKLVVQIDQTVVQAENFLRALFTFLWG